MKEGWKSETCGAQAQRNRSVRPQMTTTCVETVIVTRTTTTTSNDPKLLQHSSVTINSPQLDTKTTFAAAD